MFVLVNTFTSFSGAVKVGEVYGLFMNAEDAEMARDKMQFSRPENVAIRKVHTP